MSVKGATVEDKQPANPVNKRNGDRRELLDKSPTTTIPSNRISEATRSFFTGLLTCVEYAPFNTVHYRGINKYLYVHVV